ncbi:MAG: hypothetical protein ACREQZ_12460 [Woeseiaceae bacterium]
MPTRVAEAAFGSGGSLALNVLMWVSIFGALGGLVMTLPRLFYAASSEYRGRAAGTPAAAVALLFFGSFSRIVTFFVVPGPRAEFMYYAGCSAEKNARKEPPCRPSSII